MTKNKISQAFIFAAGRGERMRPITDVIPKPLVEINDKSIIDYTIEKLNKLPQFKTIIINSYHLADKIKEHAKRLNNPKIIVSKEPQKLETGGGLVFANKKIGLNEHILLINGDILWLEDKKSEIEIICNNFDKKDCDILLGLVKKEDFSGYDKKGDFNLEENGNLTRFPGEEMTHVFTGVQIINTKILQRPPEKSFSMSYFYKSEEFLKRTKGIELNSKFFHVGNIKAIKATEKLLNNTIFT